MKELFKNEKRRWIIVCVESFLLTVALVWGFQMDRAHSLSVSIPVILAFLGIFALTGLILILVYSLFDRAKVSAKSSKSFSLKLVFFVSFGILAAVYLVQFLALYPGLFIYDSSWQLDTFRAGEVSEHHPVLHTVMLAKIVDGFASDMWHINRGVAVYIIIQILFFSLAGAYTITYVYRKLKSLCLSIVSLAFLGLYTPVVLQVLTVTKDSNFMICFMAAAVLTLELAEDPEAFFKKPAKLVLWPLSVTLMAIFRNNCVYAVPFLFVAIILVLKKKRALGGALIGASVVLYVLYKVLFVPAFVTEKVDGREFFSVPAQQLARVYSAENAKITDSEKEVIEALIGGEGLNGYIPKNADPVKSALNMDYYKANAGAVKSTYLSLLSKNPKIFFEAFLENTLGFWYPECELVLYPDGRTGYWVINCYPYAVFNSKLPFTLTYYKLFERSAFVTGNPVTSLLFAPGTFLFVFLIMFFYAIEQKKKSFIALFSFVFVFWLTYLLGPLAMVRYINYLFALVPLYFVLVADKSNDTKSI